MHKTTANTRRSPGDLKPDPEVLAFRQQFDERSPLDEIIHEGARLMLQAAIADELGTPLSTVKRDLQALKNEGKIEFVGSPRNGHYRLCPRMDSGN